MVDLNATGFVKSKVTKPKPPAKLTPEQIASAGTEHAHQTALFAWAAENVGMYPELNMMFAIPNGGMRDPVTANKLKAEGVRSGVPDICLAVSARHLHGLFIEFKKPKKGRVADQQNEWRDNLNSYDYLSLVCYGWIEARDAILEYLAHRRGDYSY